MRDDNALEIFKTFGPTLTSAQARANGMHWEDLYRLRDNNHIYQLSRGVYRLSEAPTPEWIDLVAVLARAPQAIVCLNTAASFWGLTDEIPISINIAVPRGASKPRISYPATTVHTFAGETFLEGRMEPKLSSGEVVAVYSQERTLVDIIRTGKYHTSEPIGELIRRYLSGRGSSPSKLLQMAHTLSVESSIRRLLEIIVP